MSPKQQDLEETIVVDRVHSPGSDNATHIGEFMTKDTPGSPADLSDAPSDASEEGIDHTAALLGVMDDESDDELEVCCFSPSASQDVLDSVTENEQNTLYDVNAAAAKLESLSVASRKKHNFDDEFLDGGKEIHSRPRSKTQDSISKVKKYIDDGPLFFFDPRLVSNSTEDDYSDLKSTRLDRNKKQAALKALAMKEKASSALQAKAKKTLDLVTLPHHKMQEMKARRSKHAGEVMQAGEGLEERSQLSGVSTISAARSLYTTIPMASVRFGGADADDGTVRSQLSETSSRTARRICKGMKLPPIPKISETKAARRIRSEMSTSQMKGYFDAFSSKKGNLTVIGDTKSIIRSNNRVPVGEGNLGVLSPSSSIDSECPGFNAPPIMKTFSAASSNNSHVSCIDEDGFLISPTASIDNTEASTHASDDGVNTSSVDTPIKSSQPNKIKAPLPPLIKRAKSGSKQSQVSSTKAEF